MIDVQNGLFSHMTIVPNHGIEVDYDWIHFVQLCNTITSQLTISKFNHLLLSFFGSGSRLLFVKGFKVISVSRLLLVGDVTHSNELFLRKRLSILILLFLNATDGRTILGEVRIFLTFVARSTVRIDSIFVARTSLSQVSFLMANVAFGKCVNFLLNGTSRIVKDTIRINKQLHKIRNNERYQTYALAL